MSKLTNQRIREKMKTLPNKNNIKIWQQKLEDIENYKIQGCIIKSKEKIINQEKPNTFFYKHETQKQIKKVKR